MPTGVGALQQVTELGVDGQSLVILCYIDESGTSLGDKQTPFFVLAAVAIPVEQSALVDARVAALKHRLVPWAKPEDFEIKGRDLQRGEKFFSSLDWPARSAAIMDTAQMVAELPCEIMAVQLDKRRLTQNVCSQDQVYRLAFTRLLDDVDAQLGRLERRGMLLVDAQSDMHSSIQDQRLVDAYRDWASSRGADCHMVENPWFGNSAFYAGLQIADFAAYLIDAVSNAERLARARDGVLREALHTFGGKIRLLRIP